MPSRIQPNRIVQIREGSTAVTLDDALVDVGIAFLQVAFSIKLLSYCELDRIRPAEFDTHQVVLLEQENLASQLAISARRKKLSELRWLRYRLRLPVLP